MHPTKLATQEFISCVNWSDVIKWHKKWTAHLFPNGLDVAVAEENIKKYYMKVMEET